jgi:hypothetical protein
MRFEAREWEAWMNCLWKPERFNSTGQSFERNLLQSHRLRSETALSASRRGDSGRWRIGSSTERRSGLQICGVCTSPVQNQKMRPAGHKIGKRTLPGTESERAPCRAQNRNVRPAGHRIGTCALPGTLTKNKKPRGRSPGVFRQILFEGFLNDSLEIELRPIS